MDIKFLTFEEGQNWVSGVVNDEEFYFESKLFDGGSMYGINEGRVSKLTISYGSGWNGWDNCFVNYDRGWDIQPNTDDENKVFNAVINFLENAPTTRFNR